MKNTQILLVTALFLVVFSGSVLAQGESEFHAQESPDVLSRLDSQENDQMKNWIYITATTAVVLATTASIYYLFFDHNPMGLGTKNDRNVGLHTPTNIRLEDQLVNKHGNLQSPDIKKHGNKFM